ncbi:MAG: glycosyltransferase family 4 protein [Candidatus Falkowbacteria bacterium]
MKICLYLEFYHFAGGALFKKIGTGLLTSYRNQRKILSTIGVEYVEKWSDDCDILQINTPWIKSLYLIKKARKRGKKVIIWSHVTAEDAKDVFRFAALFSPLIKKYLTYAYGLADVVFCPTEYTKSLLLAYGLSDEKLLVMSNGVDTEIFFQDEAKRKSYREQFNLKTITIGTVALVIPRKGTDTFIGLAKTFSNNNFIWFGKKYNSLMVKPLPQDLPGNCQFTGFVEDNIAAFNALDIFVFASHEENEGMVILEAAAVGLPILVRDIPVYEGWLVHNENCLKAKTEDEFSACIKKLIDDESLRLRLGKAAVQLARSRSKAVIGDMVSAIYSSLLK